MVPTSNTIIRIERILGTYDFSEILELNDLTEEEVLLYLVEQEYLTLPNPKPADYFDD